VRQYNQCLHYLNETNILFVLMMCLTFTDFVSDVPTRVYTGCFLIVYILLILATNIFFSLYSVYVSLREKSEPNVVKLQDEDVRRIRMQARKEIQNTLKKRKRLAQNKNSVTMNNS